MDFNSDDRNDPESFRALLTASTLVGFVLTLLIESMFLGPTGFMNVSPARFLGIPTGVGLGSGLAVAFLRRFKGTATFTVVAWTMTFAALGLSFSVWLADLLDLSSSVGVILLASMIVGGLLGGSLGMVLVRGKKGDIPEQDLRNRSRAGRSSRTHDKSPPRLR